MIRNKVAGIVLAAVALQGCASVIEGTDQTIPIHTNTASAICDVTQKGHLVASTYGLRGFIPLGKSREPLTITCSAPGYAAKTVVVPSVTSRTGAATYWIPPVGATDWVAGGLNHYPGGGVAVALYPVPGQEDMRERALWEAHRQPQMIADGVVLNTMRPAPRLKYSAY